MEELLWNHPEKLLHEPLTRFSRQKSSSVGRLDLAFTDRIGRLLVVELKKGVLPRGAITQLHDYFGMLKAEHPEKAVELMVVANSIPPARALACNQYYIEAREISEKRFRDLAQEVGFVFESEKIENMSQTTSPQVPLRSQRVSRSARGHKIEKAWYYAADSEGGSRFLAFVNAKGSCSMRIFEANAGTFLEKRYLPGDFQESFRDEIIGAKPAYVSTQPNLERDCKQHLPATVFAELQRQFRES